MLKFYKPLVLIVMSITSVYSSGKLTSVYSSEKHNMFKVITNDNINTLDDTKQFLQKKRSKPSNEKIEKVNANTLEYKAIYNFLYYRIANRDNTLLKMIYDIKDTPLDTIKTLEYFTDRGLKAKYADEILKNKSFINNVERYKNEEITVNYYQKIYFNLKALLKQNQNKIKEIISKINTCTKIEDILNEESLKKLGIEKEDDITQIIKNKVLRKNMEMYKEHLINKKKKDNNNIKINKINKQNNSDNKSNSSTNNTENNIKLVEQNNVEIENNIIYNKYGSFNDNNEFKIAFNNVFHNNNQMKLDEEEDSNSFLYESCV